MTTPPHSGSPAPAARLGLATQPDLPALTSAPSGASQPPAVLGRQAPRPTPSGDREKGGSEPWRPGGGRRGRGREAEAQGARREPL